MPSNVTLKKPSALNFFFNDNTFYSHGVRSSVSNNQFISSSVGTKNKGPQKKVVLSCAKRRGRGEILCFCMICMIWDPCPLEVYKGRARKTKDLCVRVCGGGAL
uniref:Uncharacterized protein n=1 Tax=Micrurus carvalhoi TaxID=3147026 RepID=A0A2H6NE70_9SAUR